MFILGLFGFANVTSPGSEKRESWIGIMNPPITVIFLTNEEMAYLTIF